MVCWELVIDADADKSTQGENRIQELGMNTNRAH